MEHSYSSLELESTSTQPNEFNSPVIRDPSQPQLLMCLAKVKVCGFRIKNWGLNLCRNSTLNFHEVEARNRSWMSNRAQEHMLDASHINVASEVEAEMADEGFHKQGPNLAQVAAKLESS
ncbi:hypothetical protein K438DRAFT_1756020 [Mycena galopus ATCC 62051]|nr:hypothetical protein K438DRAFT_1756020 [Mycena galopus ATCC 62051]